jgi:hypothetical protein
MSNKQPTAVEWLYNELFYFLNAKSKFEDSDQILDKAKEMEKDQIINTWIDAYTTNMKAPTRDNFIMWANNYYEQTYGGNK